MRWVFVKPGALSREARNAIYLEECHWEVEGHDSLCVAQGQLLEAGAGADLSPDPGGGARNQCAGSPVQQVHQWVPASLLSDTQCCLDEL